MGGTAGASLYNNKANLARIAQRQLKSAGRFRVIFLPKWFCASAVRPLAGGEDRHIDMQHMVVFNGCALARVDTNYKYNIGNQDGSHLGKVAIELKHTQQI